MWKLLAITVAMSDTGSIAMTQIATDFVTRQACERAARELFPLSFERDLQLTSPRTAIVRRMPS